MEEVNIFTLGFNKNLQRNLQAEMKESSGLDFEILEDKIGKTLQSGDTVATSIRGLKEVEYNGI